jgi:signal transduction histidine kinase
LPSLPTLLFGSVPAALAQGAAPEGWRSRAALALLFLALAAAAAAVGVARWRLRRMTARQARLEQVIAAATRDLATANAALAASNEELRRLNDVKSEFLGSAAHDLKNPLGVVIGLSEILMEQLEEARAEMPARSAELLERVTLIRTCAEHMSVLVAQLLDTVALESGQVRLRRQKVDMGRLAASVTEAQRIRAAAKRIDIALEEGGACWADVDPDRAWEILDNLVSNAVKFSPPGRRVWVRAATKDGAVRLEVADEGPGLTEDDRQRLFGRFQKLSARPTAGEPSTGLGLSIVKTLVELHGGTIAVESAPGSGARFVVSLPAAAPEAGG